MPPYSSVRIRNLHFQYDIDNIIFNKVSLTISPNEKVAIMGKNGAGKSTLCQMLEGSISDYDGEISIDKHVKLAYVGQQMPEKYLHWKVQDFLFDARGLLEPLKDYFLVIELLAFDKNFEQVCLSDNEQNNLVNKNWTLDECIKAFDNFLKQQELPEIHMSEECAVELMLELEEIDLSEFVEEKELFLNQSLKYLRSCPDAENSLGIKEFIEKFSVYLAFLKQKSIFQFFVKNKHMAEIIEKLGDLQELYEQRGGHKLETDISEVLTLVHLEKIDMNLPIQMLSGGQKNRLLLAHSVLKNPDILILDEPTNNLDTYAYKRLTNFVKNFKNTLIVISHDSDFLNSFVQKVLYIDSFQKNIREYSGTYDQVRQEVDQQMDRERKQEHRIQSELKKTKEVYTARSQQAQVYSGSKALARGAQQLKKKIENLEAEKITKLREDKTISRFTIPCKIIDDSLLSIDTMSYWKGGSSEDFSLNFELPKSSVVLIHGENGTGKSWYLKQAICYAKALQVPKTDIIPQDLYLEMGIDPKDVNEACVEALKRHQKTQIWEGELQSNKSMELLKSTAEKIFFTSHVHLGYYSQDFSTLEMNNTVQKEMETVHPFKYEELRSILARFLFYEEHLGKKVKDLSEGQKALLSWAKLSFLSPNVLFLDEPTNHIHFKHLPIIQETLRNYHGTIVLVCHDKQFVDSLPMTHVIDMWTKKVWKWKEWRKWNF